MITNIEKKTLTGELRVGCRAMSSTSIGFAIGIFASFAINRFYGI